MIERSSELETSCVSLEFDDRLQIIEVWPRRDAACWGGFSDEIRIVWSNEPDMRSDESFISRRQEIGLVWLVRKDESGDRDLLKVVIELDEEIRNCSG